MKRYSTDTRYETDARRVIASGRDLGEMLKMRRKELSIRQADLAEATGISPRLLGEMERGKEGIAWSKILMVANMLGIDLVLEVRSKRNDRCLLSRRIQLL